MGISGGTFSGHKLHLESEVEAVPLGLHCTYSVWTCCCSPSELYGSVMLETHRGPAATSSHLSAVFAQLQEAVLESPLWPFLKQCVWEAGRTMRLRGGNKWKCVLPQQHVECVKTERTPTSPLRLSPSFFPPSLKTNIAQLYLELNVINSSVYRVSGRKLVM